MKIDDVVVLARSKRFKGTVGRVIDMWEKDIFILGRIVRTCPMICVRYEDLQADRYATALATVPQDRADVIKDDGSIV